MHIEWAAHEDHQITHSSSMAQIGLGVALALTAVAACTAGALACAGAIGLRMGIGLDIGEVVDKFLPSGFAGKIVKGYPTVLLGPGIKPAARAHEETRVDCHAKWVSQGSEIVMMGKELSPMSRRQDKTKCDGLIGEGLKTVMVGGKPSETGKQTEDKNPVVWWMNLVSGVLGAANPLKDGNIKGAVGSVAGTTLDAAGQGGLGTATKLGSGGWKYPSGGSMWDKADWAFGMKKGAGTGVDAGSAIVGR